MEKGKIVKIKNKNEKEINFPVVFSGVFGYKKKRKNFKALFSLSIISLFFCEKID